MTSRGRRTLLIYFGVLGLLILLSVISARDVMFERFTVQKGCTAISVGSDVLVLGGRNSDGDLLDSLLLVDMERSRITPVGHFGHILYGFAAAGTGDSVYFFGGMTSEGYSSDIYRIVPGYKSVEIAGTLPFPVAQGAAICHEGIIYHFGGYDGTRRRSEILAFDPAAGEVRIAAELPEARDSFQAVPGPSGVCLVGGEGADNVSFDEITEVDPATGAVLDVIPLPYRLYGITVAGHAGGLTGLASDADGRDLQFRVDYDNGRIGEPEIRESDLSAYRYDLASAGGVLYAFGETHPTATRQLGILELPPEAGTGSIPLRFHSRIWH